MNAMLKISYFEKLLEKKENSPSAVLLSDVNNWQLCRTCLTEIEDDAVDINSPLIIGVNKGLVKARDMLEHCFEMTPGSDQVLEKVCKLCLEKITTAYFFKCQMLAAENVLLRLEEKMQEQNKLKNVKPESNSTVVSRGNKEAVDVHVHVDGTSNFEYYEFQELEESEQFVVEVDNENTNEQDDLDIVDIKELSENEEQADTDRESEQYELEDFIETDEEKEMEYMLDDNEFEILTEKDVQLPRLPKASDMPFEQSGSLKIKTKPERAVVCGICHQKFDKQIRLVEHAQSQHPNLKAFKCGECKSTFKCLRTWTKHRQFHLDPDSSNHNCAMCGKRFRQLWDLNRHLRTHTNERPYVCDVCGKAFKQTTELKDHKLMHNKEKQYECKICGQRMNSRNGFYNHNKIHEGVKNFLCPHCDKRFVSSGEMKSHLKRVHMKF